MSQTERITETHPMPAIADYDSSEKSTPLVETRGVFITEGCYETEIIKGEAPISGTIVKFNLERPVGAPEYTYREAALIIHGYGGIETAYEDTRSYLASHGTTAITWEPARDHPIRSFMRYDHAFNPYKLTSKCAWGVLRATKEQFDIQGYHIVGHSMGGYTGTGIAKHKPELVRSLILAASAGMEEDLNTFSFVPRIGNFFRKELLGKFSELDFKARQGAARQALRYVFRNPAITVGEALSVSNCNIRDDVRLLGKLGVATAALQFPADTLLPPQDVDDIVQHSVMYHEQDVGHVGPQIRPEEFGQYILDIIEILHPDKESSAA